MRNILANVPSNQKQAFFLLDNILAHVKKSGQYDFSKLRHCQVFAEPQKTAATIQQCIARVQIKSRKTSSKKLQQFRKLKRVTRRKEYRHNVVVFKSDTVKIQRVASPSLHGQGYLLKPVRVHPYRPTDIFLGRHSVNVYRQGCRYDVIDALCNIPILAGLTKRGLKLAVDLSGPMPTSVYRGSYREARKG